VISTSWVFLASAGVFLIVIFRGMIRPRRPPSLQPRMFPREGVRWYFWFLEALS
jgi:hypothetical protein